MNRPHVDRLNIRNFGCVRDARIELTPLHALIGPNDSGKSTVIAALRTLTLLAAARNADLATTEGNRLMGFLASRASHGEVLPGASSGDIAWQVRIANMRVEERLVQGPSVEHKVGRLHFMNGSRLLSPNGGTPVPALVGSQLLRLDPDALRQQGQLVPEGQPLRLGDPRGSGLPGIYDAVLTRDISAFMSINKVVAELFPSVESLSLKNTSSSTKAVGVKLKDGTFVPAEAMSEGLLYYLAFAVLPYLEPTAMVLVEEPENGLHPARIADVMRVLRAVSETTQVVIATHSPLVVNELQPEEVTVLTRDKEHGTLATRIDRTPNFAERSRVYALGELWVSYCNGLDEMPLLKGDPRP